MAHDALLDGSITRPGFCAQIPVSREEQQQIAAVTVFLPRLKHGLLAGNVVTTVTIEKDEALETVGDEVVHQPIEQIEIQPWLR